MAAPASRSQIDALGDRLRKGEPRPGDEELLDALLRRHDVALVSVVGQLRTIDLGDGTSAVPTPRVKTRGTLVEKLVREKTRLSAVQDIAGARVVVGSTLIQQDLVAHSVLSLFPDSRLVDRRVDPRSGYRAVHVVVRAEGCFAEIQVRTQFQHLWAEVFERLADRVGRQIRYGEEPTVRSELDRGSESVTSMMMVSEAIAGLEDGERFQVQVLAQLASEPSSERPSVELVDTMAVYAKTLVDLRTKAEDLLDSIRGRL